MTGFDAWILDDDDARRAENAIATTLARTSRIVHDAVLISWPATRRSPKLRPAENIPRSAALGDEFWGLYFGIVFFAPRLAAAGTAPTPDAAPAEKAGCPLAVGFTTVGLPDRFSQALRTGLHAGAAAFIVLSDSLTSQRIGAALTPHGCRHIHASASDDQLARLHEIFGR
jgi:uncharacterized membrane protein